MGGWIASAGSCSSGLSEAPCTGAGSRRVKALEVNTVKARNRAFSPPCTATADVLSPNGRPRPSASTAPKAVMTRHHSSSEPSWLPQAPATR